MLWIQFSSEFHRKFFSEHRGFQIKGSHQRDANSNQEDGGVQKWTRASETSDLNQDLGGPKLISGIL